MPAPADITPIDLTRELRPAATLRSTGWIVKRALIGLFLITLFAVGGSALLYATIEPDQAAVAGE